MEGLRRADSNLLINLITGHNSLNKHQFRIGKSTTDLCRLCGACSETFKHWMTNCVGVANCEKPKVEHEIVATREWLIGLLSFAKGILNLRD